MSRYDDTPRIDPDERYELVAAARSAEARNRPTGLLVIGVAALVLSFGAFAWSYSGASSARADLNRAGGRYVNTRDLAARYVLLADTEASEDTGCTDRIQNFFSRMEQAARRANIEPPSPPREQSTPLPEGFRRVVYPYSNVTDESLEDLLDWIRLAQDEIPCLRLSNLKIRPETRGTRNEWVADITFTRTER